MTTGDRHEQRARSIADRIALRVCGEKLDPEGDILPVYIEEIAAYGREEAERCAEPYAAMWAKTLETAAEKIVAAWVRCRNGEFATADEEMAALEGPLEEMERLLQEPDEPRDQR